VSVTAIRHRFEYLVVIAVRWFVGRVPYPVAQALGSTIGLAFHAIDGAHRRLAVSQLRAAFPVRTEDECRTIARRTFVHFGQSLVMLLRVSTFSPGRLLEVVEVDGADHIRTALAARRGAIVFSGHFGYWELHGLTHALTLSPMSVLARPLDNPLLHDLLERMRRATGNNVI
jgi:KDO2-lipid IV(A) lauroyltransferase